MNRYESIADYYDAEHERVEMLRRDVPFFLRQLPRRKKVAILELCAGTARAAIPMAQAGHEVVGIERDPNMLAIAERKRDSVGLTDRQLKLMRGDVLSVNLNRKFDWVAIFFNMLLGFTTLRQQDRLLQNARRHLKRTGRLWLDIFHPDHGMLSERRSRDVDACVFYVPELDRTVSMTEDIERDMSRQLIRLISKYKWFDHRGRQHQQRTVIEMSPIFPRELQLLLQRNGFRVEKLYGGYDGEPLRAQSRRMIASCRIA